VARTSAQPSELLTALVAKLRTDLDLGERQCYQTWEPEVPPKIQRGGDYAVSVAFGEGSFDQSLFDGGGRGQLTEDMAILVTAYSRVRLDSTDVAEQAFHETERGLFILARKIVKVFAAYDPEPAAGRTCLRELLRPVRIGRPIVDKESSLGSISLQFIASWDWDLTSA